MTTDDADLAVTEDEAARRFELRRGDEVVSHATYSLRDDVVVVPHVETAPEHRGNGYADRLMAGLLELLRTSDRRIEPLCPFAAGYVRDHPDQADLVA